MKKTLLPLSVVCLALACLGAPAKLRAQHTNPSADAANKSADSTSAAKQDDKSGKQYSGMYSFLKEGEFVQVTVEDADTVTGFISRFEAEADKGEFLDQFFKTGRLDGNHLTFTTQIVHGIAFEFKGTVERGEGRNLADEGYYALKGTLTENTTDASKKVTSHTQEVAFKMFPQDAAPQ
jgi:hypothetical protein